MIGEKLVIKRERELWDKGQGERQVRKTYKLLYMESREGCKNGKKIFQYKKL